MSQKKQIDKVTKLGVLNEAPLELEKFNAIKCPRMNLSYNPLKKTDEIFQPNQF